MRRLKRILLVGLFPLGDNQILGGQAKFLHNLMHSRLARNFRLIPYSITRPLKREAADNSGYKALFNSGWKRLLLALVITAKNFLGYPFVLFQVKPAIVQLHSSDYWNFWENAFYLLVSKLFGVKIFIRFGGSNIVSFIEKSPKLLKKVVVRLLQVPDFVIVQSAMWKQFFSKYVKAEKIIILPNSVEWKQYQQNGRTPKCGMNVLFLGSNQAIRKGFYDLIRAIPEVLKQVSNIRFTLVVPNKELQSYCMAQDWSDCIRLKDWIFGEEKIEVFTNTEVFVLPSYGEGFPNSLLEAMAAGQAIIASSVGAIPEIVRHGDNGFLINPGDYRQLADYLIYLAKNPDDLARIRKTNQQIARSKYDIDTVFRELEPFYSGV